MSIVYKLGNGQNGLYGLFRSAGFLRPVGSKPAELERQIRPSGSKIKRIRPFFCRSVVISRRKRKVSLLLPCDCFSIYNVTWFDYQKDSV